MIELQCPDCQSSIQSVERGPLRCTACDRMFPHENGIYYFYPNHGADEGVKQNEKAAWSVVLAPWDIGFEDMRRNLPYIEATQGEHFHWRETSRQFDIAKQLLTPLEGKVGLDIGGQIGWASYRLAQAGARMTCVDYNDDRVSGLGSADIYLNSGVEFDRICADAEYLPIGDAQFDFVFSSAFLHHLPNPGMSLKHIARTLKPGGVYIAAMEAFCPFFLSREQALARCDDALEHMSHGINEQVFYMREYLSWFRDAGLEISVINPRWDEIYDASIGYNEKLRKTDFAPEILERRIHNPGITGMTARILLRSNLWKLFTYPFVFKAIRGPLLNATQKFRIFVGTKPLS